MLKKKAPRIAFFALVLLCGAVAGWAWEIGSTRPPFPHTTLDITRADGAKFTFKVEVARTEIEQAYGLMYVHAMPDDAGMIFPYDPPRQVAFWMKNTYLPLDMLFVGEDHRIGHIATHAIPLDVMPIPSDIPVSAVIELNAGQVMQKGFAVGDKVDYAGY